jgi:NTP pyrophosphatase (non-canonical NTP hydrolase)
MTSADTAYNALELVFIWGFVALAAGAFLGLAWAFIYAAWRYYHPRPVDVDPHCDCSANQRNAPETFPAFFKRAADWADGNFPQATRASIAEHLRREVVELQDEITADTRGAPSKKIRMELADVFLLLIHEARHNGLDGPALLAAAQAKLGINQARVRGQADAHGVVEHARSVDGDQGPSPALQADMQARTATDTEPIPRFEVELTESDPPEAFGDPSKRAHMWAVAADGRYCQHCGLGQEYGQWVSGLHCPGPKAQPAEGQPAHTWFTVTGGRQCSMCFMYQARFQYVNGLKCGDNPLD